MKRGAAPKVDSCNAGRREGGSVSYVVLGLLLLAPMTIYDLNKQFEQAISLFYRASLGGLRSALAALLERGDIEFDEVVERGRRKKIYRPTERGRARFDEWLRGPIEGSDAETAILSRLFFLGMLERPDERRAVLDLMLERVEADGRQLTALDAHLDTLEVPAHAAGIFRYHRATLGYGLAAHGQALAFLRDLRDAED